MLLNDSRWLLEALLAGIAWQATGAWRSVDVWPGEGRQGWQLNSLMNAREFRRRWSLDDHGWCWSGQRIVLLLISLKSLLLNLLLVLVGNLALSLVVLAPRLSYFLFRLLLDNNLDGVPVGTLRTFFVWLLICRLEHFHNSAKEFSVGPSFNLSISSSTYLSNREFIWVTNNLRFLDL